MDRRSLDSWLRSVHAGASTRDLMAIMSRVTWGCEPDEVSMLHAVRYVKAAGGIGPMLDVEGGAQQDRFPEGTQQIALRMADELGDRVRLGAVVERIERTPGGDIVVHSTAGATHGAGRWWWRSRPRTALRSRSNPHCREGYSDLAAHWPQGSLSKAYAAYDTPFWRAGGCSGEALSDDGPVFITFDVSPGDDGPGILLGFTDARTFDALPADERRERALELLRRAVRRRRPGTHRLRRPLLGHRGFRTGRADGGSAARLVDGLRALAAGTGRRHVLGGHRDGRPSGPGSSTGPCGRASARPPRWTPIWRLGADAALLAHRCDERTQLLVDLVRAFQDGAVPAGQFDERRELWCVRSDSA